MTTIVFAKGILAADRRVTSGTTIIGDNFRKVVRLKSGLLVAMAGGVADSHEFLEWASGDMERAAPRGSYTGVLIHPKGYVLEFENGKPLPALRRGNKFYAWGSGGSIALGALYAGASAKQAVLIASKIDCYTGGGVDTIKH